MTARVFAAGSLRAAFTEAVAAYRQQGGGEVALVFGPSGVLRERLARGEAADLFASANMEHPQALSDSSRADPTRIFARNQMCALAPASLGVTTANLLERLLDPTLRVGTSTPRLDPAGDYAWQVFERAEKVKPGAFEILSRKALKLVGGPDTPAPADRSVYAVLMDERKADVFLTYCTNAMLARREVPSLAMIALPDTLAVGAEYGLATMKGSPAGPAFAQFLLGPEGQRVLAAAGFSPPPP